MNLGRTGAILPGGGFRCAFQVGFFEAIEESGIYLEKIQAVSGGAINAVKYVESGVRNLKAGWIGEVERIGPSHVFSGVANVFYHSLVGDPALYSDKGLWRLLGQVDMAKVVSSKIKLQIVVFNEIADSMEVVFNHEFKEDEDRHNLLRRFVKASASYPGLFNPEVVDGIPYSDGTGVKSEHMADLDTIFWVETTQPRQTVNPATLASDERLMKRTSWLIDREIRDDIRENLGKFKKFPEEENDETALPFWKQMGKFLLGGPENKRLVLVRPQMPIGTLSMKSFNPKTKDISRSIQHGYERTKEIIEQLKA